MKRVIRGIEVEWSPCGHGGCGKEPTPKDIEKLIDSTHVPEGSKCVASSSRIGPSSGVSQWHK